MEDKERRYKTKDRHTKQRAVDWDVRENKEEYNRLKERPGVLNIIVD
jgi:hypothetical protein